MSTEHSQPTAAGSRPPDDLIIRSVVGKATPDEVARVAAWVGADAERQKYVNELRRTWQLGGLTLKRWNADQAWAEIVRRRSRREHAVRFPAIPSMAPRISLLGAAAALVMIAGAVLLWRVLPPRRETATAEPPRIQEYATRPGQRAELRLPDGSRVTLSVDSRIRVSTAFAVTGREVTLEGEAFFDVQHDPNRPFRVTTSRGVAEDLGTEFVVSAYPESRTMWVAVVSGEVALSAPNGGASARVPVRLGRRDVGVVDSAEIKVRRGVNLDAYVGWTAGKLVFEGVPLPVALARIEQWYDVDITLTDSALRNRRFTATLEDAPLEHALDLLALSFGLRVERQAKHIVLSSKHSVRREP